MELEPRSSHCQRELPDCLNISFFGKWEKFVSFILEGGNRFLLYAAQARGAANTTIGQDGAVLTVQAFGMSPQWINLPLPEPLECFHGMLMLCGVA